MTITKSKSSLILRTSDPSGKCNIETSSSQKGLLQGKASSYQTLNDANPDPKPGSVKGHFSQVFLKENKSKIFNNPPQKQKIGGSTSHLKNFSKPSFFLPVSITAREISMSGDYTRVVRHGPNPKTTHFFYDFKLECLPDQSTIIISCGKSKEVLKVFHLAATSMSSPNFCLDCGKNLAEEDGIYIYRENSSFCSLECLAVGILADEVRRTANIGSSKVPSVSSNDMVVFREDKSLSPAN